MSEMQQTVQREVRRFQRIFRKTLREGRPKSIAFWKGTINDGIRGTRGILEIEIDGESVFTVEGDKDVLFRVEAKLLFYLERYARKANSAALAAG